jgi:hypothetical protein
MSAYDPLRHALLRFAASQTNHTQTGAVPCCAAQGTGRMGTVRIFQTSFLYH